MSECCTQDNFTGSLLRLQPFSDKRLITGKGEELFYLSKVRMHMLLFKSRL